MKRPRLLFSLFALALPCVAGADTVTLSNRLGRIEVSLTGAQVLSYVPAGASDLLFMPADRDFTRDREMHGGIPVCWPWFGRCGEPGSRMHGLARYATWKVVSREDGDVRSRLVLALESSEATRKVWPHDFVLRYTLELTDRLSLSLESKNVGTRPYKVTQGFHPYFRVEDPAKVTVRGLDRPLKAYPGIDGGHPKGPRGAYCFNADGRGGAVSIRAVGETKLVVWNPGDGWDGWTPDCNLKRGDWPKFLCVEPAVLGRENAVEVPPGGMNALKMTVKATSPLKGRVTDLERIGAKNARAREDRAWCGSAWRNERVNMPFVVWSDCPAELTAAVGELKGPGGAAIPARVRWVGEVIVDDRPHGAKVDPVKYPPYLSGDILDSSMPFTLTEAGHRALWVSVKTPADARPGVYRGELRVTMTPESAAPPLVFPLTLDVRAMTLPKVKRFHLDIWQTPWTIARYYGVKPFSPEHYAKMEPFLRELADAGQKAITTTITDYPWNERENIDSARSMVKYVKRRDGTFAADFSVMDEYVRFAERCGIGPQIHCYAPVKFERSNTYQYLDEATGRQVSVKLLPATPEYEAYWGPLLTQLEAHAREKGWADRLYVALDELPGGETAATAALIAKYAPSAKFHMAGNRSPENFKGIKIDGYSQLLGSKLMTEDFLKGLEARRRNGQFTTLYTCCVPFRPNALPMSPLYEQRWLALYIAAKGFDGYLKSTFFRWTPSTDPLKDAHCYPSFPCGDSYLVYPGPRSSLRWESLVDGIEDCEKIRVLRESGGATPGLEAALRRIDLPRFHAAGKTAAEDVRAVLRELDRASAAGASAPAVPSAEILETKVICREEGRYLGWPTVCRCANGELLVVFSGDRDQHVCPWGKVQMIRSADDGKTWSAPATIQNGLLDDRDAGLVELRDGSLLLNWFTSVYFYIAHKGQADSSGASRSQNAEYVRHYEKLPRELVREQLGFWTARSTDGGRTWSKPARTPGTLPHGRTELRDGRILAITRRFANEGLFLKDEPGFDQIGHHILCEESSDGGRSWKAIADLQPADGVSLVDLHEPHLVELPDGRLVAQARWHKNPMPGSDGMGLVQTESSDGGKTWSKLTPTKIVGFPPHLLVLKDGRLITVYAKRIAGLCGEYACVSNDGGRTWDVEHEILLEPFVNGDLGYPSSVQLADGSLLTVYYQPPRAGEPTAILMTRWRLR